MPNAICYAPLSVGVNRQVRRHSGCVIDEPGIPGDLYQTGSNPIEVRPPFLNRVRKV